MTWLNAVRPWLPLVLIGALGLLVNHLQDSAYVDGYSKAQVEGELALEKMRGDHQASELARAKVEATNAKDAAKRLQDEQSRNDKLATELADKQRNYHQTTDRLTGEIARVNDLYRKALNAEPEPVPTCVFTAGFVRVWDEATGAAIPVPAAADTGRAAAQSTETRAAEQLDSGISQREVLAHHVRYAEQCRSTSAQLDALIDAVQGSH